MVLANNFLDLDHFLRTWFRASEEPDTNASSEDQGYNVGDHHCVDELVFTLGGLEHGEAFGAALGRTHLFPLFWRKNVWSGAPVPDEVRDLSILDIVDVDITEVSVVRVFFSLIVRTAGGRLG